MRPRPASRSTPREVTARWSTHGDPKGGIWSANENTAQGVGELSRGAVGRGAAQEGQTPRSVRACRLAGLGPPAGEPVRRRARRTTRLHARTGVPSSGAGPYAYHRLRKRSPEYALLECERKGQGTCSITVRGGRGVKSSGFAAHEKPFDTVVSQGPAGRINGGTLCYSEDRGRVRATSTLPVKQEV